LSRNMVVEIDYTNDKKLKIIGNPIKMSEIDQEVFKAPPRFGADTEQVLAKMLNYSPEEIEELKQQNII
ncbi:CoA transferase, partial [Chloroflexota bacterium]